jgi:hypothetical protein
MLEKPKPLTPAEIERMAAELEAMSQAVRARPEMNHHFADRLAGLARQMREDGLPIRSVSEAAA